MVSIYIPDKSPYHICDLQVFFPSILSFHFANVFFKGLLLLMLLSHFSRVQLCATP